MVAADQGGGPLKYILEAVINSVLLRPPIEIVHQADAVHGLPLRAGCEPALLLRSNLGSASAATTTPLLQGGAGAQPSDLFGLRPRQAYGLPSQARRSAHVLGSNLR